MELKQNYIYLHGFNSARTGRSYKIEKLKSIGNVTLANYDSFATYEAIIDNLAAQIKNVEDPIFIGTSLGAYYANEMATLIGAPSVLINPLLNPARFFRAQVGRKVVDRLTGDTRIITSSLAKSYTKILGLPPVAHMCPYPLILMDAGDKKFNSYESQRYFLCYKRPGLVSLIHIFEGGTHRFDHIEESLPLISNYANLCELAGEANV